MKKLTNPLDELFEIEQPVNEVVENNSSFHVELSDSTPDKDEEDAVIDGKIDAVYTAAFDAFNQQTQYTEIIEPRYAARNAEVAANYLNIALSAATARAKVKVERKKTSPVVFGGNVQNGNVIATREEILRMIAVDAETKETKET